MSRVSIASQGTVGVVTMDHERENRFHPDFMDDFMRILDGSEKDPAIRALVVTSADPKFWSNGLDLGWLMANISSTENIIGYLRKINALYRRVTLYPKPMVAALNGHTFAGGCFLAAHMDFRFMREDRGWICAPEVDINIPLLPGMVAIMRSVTSAAGFREMYFTGKRFTGPEALAIGYADRVCAADDLLPQSVAFAAMLGAKKTRTYAEMKRRLKAEIVQIMDDEDPLLFLPTLALSMPD